MLNALQLYPFLGALLGGAFPALIWLWFFLREDSTHPEPRRLLFLAFVAGMISVAFAIWIEQNIANYVHEQKLMFTLWSCVEEILKFTVAYIAVLRLKEDDEPIDPVIYMVTVALGFAAVENTLFLLSNLAGNTALQIAMTGNLRFIGATLLHVLTSALIGVSLGIAFYQSRKIKIEAGLFGLALACTVHALFNFHILSVTDGSVVKIFSVVWIGIVILIGLIEYVKRVRP